jgi:hypothetical protein
MRDHWCVQFLWLKVDSEHSASLLIEQLRYAQLVSVIKEDENHFILRMFPPKGIREEYTWAFQTSNRMKSFGLNAEINRM